MLSLSDVMSLGFLRVLVFVLYFSRNYPPLLWSSRNVRKNFDYHLGWQAANGSNKFLSDGLRQQFPLGKLLSSFFSTNTILLLKQQKNVEATMYTVGRVETQFPLLTFSISAFPFLPFVFLSSHLHHQQQATVAY